MNTAYHRAEKKGGKDSTNALAIKKKVSTEFNVFYYMPKNYTWL